ncbi:hypothetical protein PR048_023950 [Dryococelus australis]|uniref:Uncharacterized protein n=1 Tax=Dryococelus australis TaxID=614101 RepID=A0ABQ9GVI4_9NEOP|nr:hypothetical protein PR048_023950 [Dryococelus australis]
MRAIGLGAIMTSQFMCQLARRVAYGIRKACFRLGIWNYFPANVTDFTGRMPLNAPVEIYAGMSCDFFQKFILKALFTCSLTVNSLYRRIKLLREEETGEELDTDCSTEPSQYPPAGACRSRPRVSGVIKISAECSGLLASYLSARLGVRLTFQVKASGYKNSVGPLGVQLLTGGKSATVNIRAAMSATADWTIGLDPCAKDITNDGNKRLNYMDNRFLFSRSRHIDTCGNNTRSRRNIALTCKALNQHAVHLASCSPWEVSCIMQTNAAIAFHSNVILPAGHTSTLFASQQGEPGSIPDRVATVFSHVGIMPDDAAGRRVISGIFRFPRPCIPTLHHTHLTLHPRWLSRPRCVVPSEKSCRPCYLHPLSLSVTTLKGNLTHVRCSTLSPLVTDAASCRVCGDMWWRCEGQKPFVSRARCIVCREGGKWVMEGWQHARDGGENEEGRDTCCNPRQCATFLPFLGRRSVRRLHTTRRRVHTYADQADQTACTVQRYGGNTSSLARRSDEAIGVRVSVARIAPPPPMTLDVGFPRGSVTCEHELRHSVFYSAIVTFMPSAVPMGITAGRVKTRLVARVLRGDLQSDAATTAIGTRALSFLSGLKPCGYRFKNVLIIALTSQRVGNILDRASEPIQATTYLRADSLKHALHVHYQRYVQGSELACSVLVVLRDPIISLTESLSCPSVRTLAAQDNAAAIFGRVSIPAAPGCRHKISPPPPPCLVPGTRNSLPPNARPPPGFHQPNPPPSRMVEGGGGSNNGGSAARQTMDEFRAPTLGQPLLKPRETAIWGPRSTKDKERSGRPSVPADVVERIREATEQSPRASTLRPGRKLYVPQSTVWVEDFAVPVRLNLLTRWRIVTFVASGILNLRVKSALAESHVSPLRRTHTYTKSGTKTQSSNLKPCTPAKPLHCTENDLENILKKEEGKKKIKILWTYPHAPNKTHSQNGDLHRTTENHALARVQQVKKDLSNANINSSEILDKNAYRRKTNKWEVLPENEDAKRPGTKWSEERKRIHGEKMRAARKIRKLIR